MSRVLLGIPDEDVEAELRVLLKELDGVEIVGAARTSSVLADLADRVDADVVIVHEDLGPDSVLSVTRDFGARFPHAAVLHIAPNREPRSVIRAMESGARGVLAHPFGFEDVSSKFSIATEWSAHMRRVLAGAAEGRTARASVITVCGAKGGVGVTTVVTHLAMDNRRLRPHDRICIVDLDLEKGDVSAILDVRQAVSVADVAKVHRDLSAATVRDALVEHESGVSLLLAPADVRETEYITTDSLRSIIAVLRREFDLVLIDAGGYVSPSQGLAVELADETIMVTTSDVLAVRAMRKRMTALELLGVKQEGEFFVLVNRVDKTSTFPAAAISQLTTANVIEPFLPESRRTLELANNERDPRAITEVAWWRLIQGVRETVSPDNTPRPQTAMTATREPGQQQTADGTRRQKRAQRKRSGARKGRRQKAPDRGSITLENLAIFPLVILLLLIGFQIVVIGASALAAGQAAAIAARDFAVSGNVTEATIKAREGTPGPFDDITVQQTGPNTIKVVVPVPAAAPAFLHLPTRITTTRTVVPEP